MTNIDLSIIVVTYNTEVITFNCVKSVLESKTSFNFEVIVVDNFSSDNTVKVLRESFNKINVISLEENSGFSKGNNIGIRNSKGKYILLLNSDTLVFQDSIENLMSSAIRNDYEICGPVLLNVDNTVQRSWFDFPSSIKVFLRLTEMYLVFYKLSKSFIFKLFYSNMKPAFMFTEINNDTTVGYLSFACILIKKEIIEKIGDLDESLFFYHEDCEYGFRAKANSYKINYTIASEIIHLGGASSSQFSIFAFENDIKGLLHIYKKYHNLRDFKILKFSIILALQWRIIFWHFGYFKYLNKFGFYDDSDKKSIKSEAQRLLKKYKELMRFVTKYSY